MHYKFGGTVILLLASLLVLTIVFGSWYTLNQTQRGVLLRNGALVEVM
jgi:regulator of protease activity HflC (stomatin/prohibitin superfamily)